MHKKRNVGIGDNIVVLGGVFGGTEDHIVAFPLEVRIVHQGHMGNVIATGSQMHVAGGLEEVGDRVWELHDYEEMRGFRGVCNIV